MSKFLTFKKAEAPLEEYVVKDKQDNDIGYIFFYNRWKRWVFEPVHDNLVFDAECLRDIASFMEKLK